MDKEFVFRSVEHKSYTEMMLNLFLGQSINYYKNYCKETIDEGEIECLKKAKDARNYICHESTIGFIYSTLYSKKKYIWDDLKLRNCIADLAEADYYVSRWTYEFQENESGSFFNKTDYINKILNWVFDNY